MAEYRIRGNLGDRGSALEVSSSDGAAYRIGFQPELDGAALFDGDRRLLTVVRRSSGRWEVSQDGVLRARIQADSGWFLHPFIWVDPFLWRNEEGWPWERRRWNARTDIGQLFIRGDRDQWNYTIESGSRLAEVRRLPDGYSIQTEAGTDRFLMLGLALFLVTWDRWCANRPAERQHTHVIVAPRPSPRPPRRKRRPAKRPPFPPMPPRRPRRFPVPGFPFSGSLFSGSMFQRSGGRRLGEGERERSLGFLDHRGESGLQSDSPREDSFRRALTDLAGGNRGLEVVLVQQPRLLPGRLPEIEHQIPVVDGILLDLNRLAEVSEVPDEAAIGIQHLPEDVVSS